MNGLHALLIVATILNGVVFYLIGRHDARQECGVVRYPGTVTIIERIGV